MLKSFVANLMLLLLANLLVKPLWVFGIDLQVQQQVGLAAYGSYAALLSFTLLPSMLLDMGITQYCTTGIARQPEAAGTLLMRLLPAKLLLAAVYVVVLLVAAFAVGNSLYHSELMIALAANQVLAGLLAYVRSGFSGLHLFKTDTLFSVADKLLMLLFCGMLMYSGWFPPLQIQWFAYAQSAAYLLTLLPAVWVLGRHTSLKTRFMPWREIIRSLRPGLPYAILTVLMVVYTRSDMLLLERLLPDGTLHSGRYAQAYRLFDAFNMVAVLAASLLLPIFSRQLALKNSVNQLAGTAAVLLVVPACCLAVFCGHYAWPVMHFLYQQQVAPDSVVVFRMLMAGFAFMCSNYVFSTLLTANGNIRLLCGISAAAILLNLSLNLWLIPTGGQLGAGFSSVATFCFVALCNLFFCFTKKLVTPNWTLLAKSSLIPALCWPLASFMFQAGIRWPLALAGVGGVYLLAMPLLGLVRISQVRQLLEPFTQKRS